MHASAKAISSGAAIVFFAGYCLADETIEEILVVSQKRIQSLQDVPVSVSVLSGERIERAGIQDVFDAAHEIASFTVIQNTAPINTSFRLRRIGNEPNIPNFEPAVGLFVDGAFRARTGVAVGDLFDVDRIEVLKGPQTVLYGKSTTAGVVSIITRRPTESFEASGRVSLGRMEGYDLADMTRIDAAISGPLTDSLGARLSGAYFDHGHTMKNLFVPDDSQDMSRYSLRGQLSYTPNDDLDATLILGKFVIDSANTSEFEIDEGMAFGATNAAFGRACPEKSSTDRAFCNNHAVITDMEADDATLIVDVDLNDYLLTSITGYEAYDMERDFDADQLNLDIANIVDRQSSESYTQEIRVLSPERESVQWLSGLYYYRNEFSWGDPVLPSVALGSEAPFLQLPIGVPFGEPGDAGILTSRSKTEHVSVFGNLTWHASRELTLTAGSRWQREDKSSIIVNAANHSTPTLITLIFAPPSASANLSRDTDGFSWNLAGQYQWSANFMTYVSASKGFKSGGFNAGFHPTPGASREFDDESVINYELGAKSTLAGDRVRLNASVFRAEYDDFQSAGFVSLRFRVNNAEQVKVSGLELDVEALLGDSVTISTSISYADAQYGLYTAGACHFNRVPDNADGTACVLTGSSLPLAPKLKTWFNAEYERQVSIGTIYLGADWVWVDRHNTNATLDPRHVQAPYSLFNLRGGLRFGRFDVSAWVKNLGDETFVMQDGPTNLFPGDPAFARFLGAPRAYGVTLSAGW
jgi:iron complex outermembrane receptor protein